MSDAAGLMRRAAEAVAANVHSDRDIRVHGANDPSFRERMLAENARAQADAVRLTALAYALDGVTGTCWSLAIELVEAAITGAGRLKADYRRLAVVLRALAGEGA